MSCVIVVVSRNGELVSALAGVVCDGQAVDSIT